MYQKQWTVKALEMDLQHSGNGTGQCKPFKMIYIFTLFMLLHARKEIITHRSAIVIIDPKKSHYSKRLSDIVALIAKERNPRDSLADATTARCAFFASPEISIRSVVHFEVTPSIRFLQVGAPCMRIGFILPYALFRRNFLMAEKQATWKVKRIDRWVEGEEGGSSRYAFLYYAVELIRADVGKENLHPKEFTLGIRTPARRYVRYSELSNLAEIVVDHLYLNWKIPSAIFYSNRSNDKEIMERHAAHLVWSSVGISTKRDTQSDRLARDVLPFVPEPKFFMAFRTAVTTVTLTRDVTTRDELLVEE
ncbi:hypothetical protein DBV15_06221 [Temnothorax longispinosus]|uniref:Uncharacterized protein n=1 Tax=Temnothorax longispinosus TaxID=300112 RepID=A0A4S2KPG0_9HYME|nr:hypothetical protein DBV15_06221 [Temnothorax longispinosus]